MKQLDLKNKWVLVTGASSGLGYEIAWQLALDHSANVILAARRTNRLEELKRRIEANTPSKAAVVGLDMENIAQTITIAKEIIEQFSPSAAVLNAGITYFGAHNQISAKIEQQLIKVNLLATFELISIFHQYFTQRKAGALEIISSMSVYFPVPYQALYSGTKSAVFSFGFALAHENELPNYSITLYTPGGIATEMTDRVEFNGLKSWMMPVEKAASEAIWALVQRKKVHTPGFFNRLGSFFMRLLPRNLIAKNMSKMYKKSLGI